MACPKCGSEEYGLVEDSGAPHPRYQMLFRCPRCNAVWKPDSPAQRRIFTEKLDEELKKFAEAEKPRTRKILFGLLAGAAMLALVVLIVLAATGPWEWKIGRWTVLDSRTLQGLAAVLAVFWFLLAWIAYRWPNQLEKEFSFTPWAIFMILLAGLPIFMSLARGESWKKAGTDYPRYLPVSMFWLLLLLGFYAARRDYWAKRDGETYVIPAYLKISAFVMSVIGALATLWTYGERSGGKGACFDFVAGPLFLLLAGGLGYQLVKDWRAARARKNQ